MPPLRVEVGDPAPDTGDRIVSISALAGSQIVAQNISFVAGGGLWRIIFVPAANRAVVQIPEIPLPVGNTFTLHASLIGFTGGTAEIPPFSVVMTSSTGSTVEGTISIISSTSDTIITITINGVVPAGTITLNSQTQLAPANYILRTQP